MDDLARAPCSSATPASWHTDAATAALTGVVTAYRPVQRWPRAAQWAMHGGMGALTAGATGWFMSRPGALDDPDATTSPPPPAAFIAVVADRRQTRGWSNASSAGAYAVRDGGSAWLPRVRRSR